MSVTSTGNVTTTYGNGVTKVSGAKNDVGKNSFLQLLMTQMQYQDPLNPSDSTQSVTQLAQFNTLEQMENLNNSFTKMLKWFQMTQASSLIGKPIQAIVSTGVDENNDGKIDTSTLNGTVAQVNYKDGEPSLLVAGEEIKLDNVVKIFPEAKPVEAITVDNNRSQNSSASNSSNASSNTSSDSSDTGSSEDASDTAGTNVEEIA
jgi:flagellar basal-body rod modification protein FlgD